MDTQLVEKIVHEVKSQGVFDEFRKDSMADVDTKPAYQNLRQRVETTVKKLLSEQKWTPETNKNQLREKLRRHITESGFLDVGVERIVDQVVNPKIGSVFQPRIEEIAYNYLGLPPPPKKYEPPPPPLMHPLPPLPIAPPPLKVETCSLLPNDLEQVSPDSDKATVKSGIEGDDKTEVDMDTDDKILDDEDESPPFEPLVPKEEDVKVKQEITILKTEQEDFALGEVFKKGNEDSSSNIKVNLKEEIDSQESNNITPEKVDKEVSYSMDCRVFQDSQLSSVSSDTRLSPETKDDSSLLRSSQEEAVTANISEEAQMPKFNENSSETNTMNGCKKEKDSELHFDIKKDEIKFEGTERKINVDNNSHELHLPEEEIKCALSAEMNLREDTKTDEFKFVSNNNSNMEPREDDGDRTPIADELSFGSSMENSISISPANTDKITTNYKEKFMRMEEKSTRPITPKLQQPSTPTSTQTPTTTPTATPTPPPPFTQTPTTIPSPVSTQKTERDQQNSRHSSSSSSSKHKKHSKERRRSHDRERDKERYRSSSGKDSKYRGSSGGKSGSSKHYSSSSTKNSSSSSSHNKSSLDKDKDKDQEKSSSSTHSSSKTSKHSSADKRHHSSASTHRDHSSSSSTTSTKRNERKDDHYEAKHKAQRRKSTDSNDDNDKGSGGGRGVGGKTCSQHSKSGNTSTNRTKSKPSNEVNQSPSNNTNETQKDQLPTESAYIEGTLKKPQIKNNVVFLNNLLENSQTQFIELDTRGHIVGTPQSAAQQNTTALFLTTSTLKDNPSELLPESTDLLYFEDMQSKFMDRFNLLNETMDLCRRSVNSLRFDSPIDEGIELCSEDDYNRCSSASLNFLSASLKRKSNVNYEKFEKTPRKRCIPNKSEECPLKTSPSPSDSSVNSKENEEIDKNTDQYKKLERNKAAAAAVQKLSQQQRYSSDDLYKPRPILGQRSRRRGVNSIV